MTILRPSYLHNGISYTGKITSLYWIRPLVLSCWQVSFKYKMVWARDLSYTLIGIMEISRQWPLVNWVLKYQKQVSRAWIIDYIPHSAFCGIQLLILALDTCFWHRIPKNISVLPYHVHTVYHCYHCLDQISFFEMDQLFDWGLTDWWTVAIPMEMKNIFNILEMLVVSKPKFTDGYCSV